MKTKRAEQLREKAKALLVEAKKLEDAETFRLGELVREYRKHDWTGLTLDRFKAAVNEVLDPSVETDA